MAEIKNEKELEALISKSNGLTKCLEKARDNYATCIVAAEDDQKKKDKCLKTLTKAITKCQV